MHSPPTHEPSSFKEALTFPKWQQVMSEEYSTLIQQGTSSLVPLPPQAPVIDCKWIFKIKRNSDGSVARYQARLVAQGFQQTEEIDYTKTFSPVVKQPTIRIVLSLAVSFDWISTNWMFQMPSYMALFRSMFILNNLMGYVNPQFPHHVCKLHRALYGFKQAPMV